jgi:hypothetical protein
MIREVGVWIDFRKAIIVTIIHPEDGINRIHADLHSEVCFPEISVQDSLMQETGSRKSTRGLGAYYEDVIACIREAESIQIFGPDETKLELEKQLQRRGRGKYIVVVETAVKMTERQIEAKVWRHFLSQS